MNAPNGPIMLAAFPIGNGYMPEQGPKALYVAFDFSTIAQQLLDLTREETTNVIQNVQTIYINNRHNAAQLLVRVLGTNQEIVAEAGSCLTYHVFAMQGTPFKALFSTTPAANLQVEIQLINVPLAPVQNGPITVNATVNPVAVGEWTDFSDVIAVGSASQTCIPANPDRLGFIVQNPVWADPESLFINFTDPAAVDTLGSIEVHPGETWPPQGAAAIVSTQEITITAATTGHSFIAKELAP